MFYLDIEGKPSDYQLRWLLNDLNSQLEYFKFLGYYDEMIVEEA
jgi:prephenate dehydratase